MLILDLVILNYDYKQLWVVQMYEWYVCFGALLLENVTSHV